jgi:hypothetical protein
VHIAGSAEAEREQERRDRQDADDRDRATATTTPWAGTFPTGTAKLASEEASHAVGVECGRGNGRHSRFCPRAREAMPP